MKRTLQVQTSVILGRRQDNQKDGLGSVGSNGFKDIALGVLPSCDFICKVSQSKNKLTPFASFPVFV
jgi:hypothetical protein